MKLFYPFKKSVHNPFVLTFDNSNRIARIFHRYQSHKQKFMRSIRKGVPLIDLARALIPYQIKDALYPPILALELTNYCNLKCPYCTSPLGLRERGYMSDALFKKIILDLQTVKCNRVQLVGNGESTLHPNFGAFIQELGKSGKFVSIVTNGNWIKKEVPHQLIKSNIDLIEISIDAGGKEMYEKSRINGNYEHLISNLQELYKYKVELKSKTMINIRLMVRPSELNKYNQEISFWSQFADQVMPQYLTKINNTQYNNDLFLPIQNLQQSYPKCSLPFMHLEVKHTGEVLMCYYSQFQTGGKGLVIGNVNDSSIAELWNSPTMKQYREAHRKRIESKMQVCKGCPGT